MRARSMCSPSPARTLEETRFRIHYQGQELSVHPRVIVKEVVRLRASGNIDYGA
jgi:hypothetical protein